MVTKWTWLLALRVLALALAASNSTVVGRQQGSDEDACRADCEDSSILQRLSRGLANSSLTLRHAEQLMGLQPQIAAEVRPEEEPFMPAPCLAHRLAAVPLAALAVVLFAAVWSLVSRMLGSDYTDVPAEETGRLVETVSRNLCMAILWLGLHTVVAVYASYLSNGTAAAVTLCFLCSGATVYEHFIEPALSKLTDKKWTSSEVPAGLSQTLLLHMATMPFLLKGRVQGLEIAWLLSLIGMGPAVYFASELCWQQRLVTPRWAAVSGQAILLATLTLTYSSRSGTLCEWADEPWDAAGNPELAIAVASFVLFVFGLFSMSSGKPKRRIAFLALMLLIASPGFSALSGKVILYGPWGMFGGTHDGHRLTGAGYGIFGCAALAVMYLSRYSDGTLGLDWDRSGERPSLALVRVLLPFWLLCSSHWGYSMPFLEWHYPGAGPWGGLLGPAILIASLGSLVLGAWSYLGALIAATGFFFGLARMEFDTDSPVRCVTMLLMILAYTPCDCCFSLIRQKDDSLWAKSLFRLHMSFLYFWAALFKVQSDWLHPGDGTLYKDIQLLQTSPIRQLVLFFLRTDGAIRAATTAIAWSTVAIELLLAFALWRKSLHLGAVVAAALLHLAMSLLCGELGGFTQAAWIGLIGSLEHEQTEKFLADPRKFAATAVGCVIVMGLIGWAF